MNTSHSSNQPRSNHSAPMRSWATERLSSTVRLALDRLASADDIQRIAVMPDVHPAGDFCVGTAFATTALIYPDAIGGDIGCGMAAVPFDAFRHELTRDALALLHDVVADAIPIQRHRAGLGTTSPQRLPDVAALSSHSLRAHAERDGLMQLGTLGRGNHFFEVQADESGRLWMMIHSGSRGMGQAIRSAHINGAERGRRGLKYFDASTERGQAYLNDMHWARRYAKANRDSMLASVASSAKRNLGWQVLTEHSIDCDHNHINVETHDGIDVFLHRKGAMAAFDGMPGIVPGSMAGPSFHVTGKGVAEALCSSAHGAGRAMSRSESRRRIRKDHVIQACKGVSIDPRIIGGLREEAPAAYKDVRAVMKAQRALVTIDRTPMPVLVHKGVGK